MSKRKINNIALEDERKLDKNMLDKTSLRYWHNYTKKLDIPQPATLILLFNRESGIDLLDDDDLTNPKNIKRMESFKTRIKDFLKGDKQKPFFLRTDFFSGKHSWKNTCYVENLSLFVLNLRYLVEESEIHLPFGPEYTALVVREFLDLDTAFTAFMGDLPIGRERRYFIKDGKVVCRHHYWIQEAIEQTEFTVQEEYEDTWKDVLADLNTETVTETSLLTSYAKQIAAVLPGSWSIDFAKGRNGVWYFIDAALAEDSWHPDDCPFTALFPEK